MGKVDPMTKAKLTRTLHEIECDVCGNVFKQKRHWQAFCSQDCRRQHHALKGQNASDARERVNQLERELARLKGILEDANIPY